MSLSMLVMVAPIMLVLALWIKIFSNGPVFFRQTRIGLGGQPFAMLKFRTMRVSVDTSIHQAHVLRSANEGLPMSKLDENDASRIIPGGKLIRLLGLDELPQLLNVLRGEMSLVGPRPCLDWEYRELYKGKPGGRFSVLPGITGLWQVSGKNHLTFQEMLELDLDYAKQANLALDLSIIARTPYSILKELVEQQSKLKSEENADEIVSNTQPKI